MKILNYFMAAGMIILLASCNDWLSLNPETERTKDKMFSTESGFKDALTGVYIQMYNDNAYGNSLMFGTIEHMASLYTTTSTSMQQRLSLHQWTDSEVETKVNTLFAQLYTIISSANVILNDIDQQKTVFKTKNMYELIKGEALALRAYCHFDLMRLFGATTGSKADVKLSYVTRFGKDLTPAVSREEFMRQLLEDVHASQKLLKPIDEELFTDPAKATEYFAKRSLRFNYYAVRALEARIQLWLGNSTEALAAADEVIKAGEESSPYFNLGSSIDFASGDVLFSNEHIVALYDFSLEKKYTDIFRKAIFYKGTSYTKGIKNELYGNSTSDIRCPEVGKWWSIVVVGNGTNYCITEKYNQTGYNNKRIPLIRLAEMYLIAAECAPLAQANTYWDTYQRSRNLKSELTESNRRSLLLKEYRKELYAEGQIFFTYKRLSAIRSEILWAPSKMVPDYMIPLPKTEVIEVK